MSKSKRVRVRTYRHGLGDCHLVSFTRADKSLFHVLIDCGVVDLTPNPGPLMSGVAQDIAKETKGEVDLVIATHQHTDHLSGFEQAEKDFADMKFKRLWLAWTEEPGNKQADKVKRELGKALAAVSAAVTALEKNEKESAPAKRIRGVLDFVGPLGVAGAETQAILDKLQNRPEPELSYHKPGTFLALPEVPNVRVYVLGPPLESSWLKICNPRKTKKEGYEQSPAADALGFVDALIAHDGNGERSQPFAQAYRRSPGELVQDSFFQAYHRADDAWRRIDSTWLEHAEQLALALDNYTNNTSLALAFEFIDTGEVLLFPGDAQVGSWLSWHELAWEVPQGNGTAKKITMADLFARTVFYKASHHASHNGTLSTRGLELMTHRDLVAFVPVDRAMAKKKHWDRTLPWQPLLDRLTEVTRGRLVLTDTAEQPPVAADLKQLTPRERKRFKAQVTVTKEWAQYSL